MSEIKYNKYKSRGAGFHYNQINKSYPMVYNAYMAARHIIVQKLIVSYCPQIKRIADFGCGDGVLLSILNRSNLEIYGIDEDKNAIEFAQSKNSDIHFKQRSVYQSSFPDKYFDLIISIDVIEHLYEPLRMLEEINRVSHKNSIIILGTPIKLTKQSQDPCHVKEYEPREFEEMLHKFFKIRAKVYTHPTRLKAIYEKSIKLFGREVLLNRLVINLLSIYLFNLFIKQYQKSFSKSYMFYVCQKE